MSISWGKVIGGVAAITGVAVAGIGVGGDSLAGVIGNDTVVGNFIDKAAETITSTAGEAAKAVGMSDATIASLGGNEGIAAIVGGVAAVAGGAALAFSGNKHTSHAQGSQDEQLENIISMLPPEAKAQLLEGLKMALGNQNPHGLPPIPGGKGQGIA